MSGVFRGSDSPNPFGATFTQGQNSVFGKTTPFGQTQNQSSLAPQSSVFGQIQSPSFGHAQTSVFGSPSATTTTSNVFGNTSSPFMSSVLGSGSSTSDSGNQSASTMEMGVAFGQQNPSSVQVTSAGTTGSRAQIVFAQQSPPPSQVTPTEAGTQHQPRMFGGKTYGHGNESSGSKIKFPFISQNFSQSSLKQTASGFGGISSGWTDSAVFGDQSSNFGGGKMKTATGFGQSSVETSRSSVFGIQSTAGPTATFESVATVPSVASGPSQPNLFGSNVSRTESNMIKPKSAVFGGSGTAVFGGQNTIPVSGSFGVQMGTQSGSVFGKTTTTSSVSASGMQPQKYVAPVNNVFGASTTTAQTSVSSIFGGSKTFGTVSQPVQAATSQFTFSTMAPSVAHREADSKPVEDVTSSSERLQRRQIRREREQGTSERGIRNIFSQALAGVVKREVDAAFTESNEKLEKSSETPAEEQKKKLRRLSSVSSSDLSSKVAIVCKGIPPRFNKKSLLQRHFSKFGSVSKVFTNTNKSSATIHFHDHNSASIAKRKGGVLAKGIPTMQIFWSSYTAPSKFPVASTSPQDRSRKKERSTVTKERKSKWSGDDVDDELQSMAGTSDVRHSSVHVLERPKDSPSKRSSGFSSDAGKRSDVSPSRGETVSIQYLSKAVAKSIQEKMHVLDQRDKLIRQARAKQRNLATARAFIGTCQDMCPEKERYDREDKRRLSCYEYMAGTENIGGQNPKADHSRCVKEYSRASADQEEPMPHELRPEHVLVQTMTYLLKDIADRGQDSNWCDWYQFLWDRTRGIRKEITQQQLCTSTAVELIEKCVRFHVFCSERLCEEDMNVFDEKINNENLTKCLQTLKEFYHDLERKHGIFCSNEAEFRAYIVLMNLNEGDTLREVQELRPDIRNAREVKLAIRVYHALDSNNYVRFFRLVKELSFLSACIVHRYFNQVRQKALATILKAHGGKQTKFPLQDLFRLLAFESSHEARDFCEFYGLDIQDDDVVLERSSFIIPETAFMPLRSINLIESKRNVPVGEVLESIAFKKGYLKNITVASLVTKMSIATLQSEWFRVINGGPFGPFNPPPPSSSFDDEGKFQVTDDLKAQVLGKSSSKSSEISAQSEKISPRSSVSPIPPLIPEHKVEVLTVIQDQTPVYKVEPEKPKINYSNEAVKLIAKDLFLEVIDEYVLDMSRGVVQSAHELVIAAQNTAEELIESTSCAVIREVCMNVYEEELASQKECARRERESSIARVSEFLSEELIQSVTDQESTNLATAEVREILALLKQQRMERCTQHICDNWIEKCVSDMVDEISAEVHQVDVVERLRQLEDIERCIKLHRAGRFLQIWKKQYADRMKLKRAMIAFPCAPSCQSISTQLKQLLPDRESTSIVDKSMYVSRHAQMNIDSPVDTFHRSLLLTAQISLKCLHQHLLVQKAWQSLDVVSLVGQQIKNAYLQSGYQHLHLTVPRVVWKLIVSLPDQQNGCWSDEVNTWMSAKFHRAPVPSHPMSKYKGEVLCLYHGNVKLVTNQSLQLGVCVRSLVGNLQQQEMEQVKQNQLLLGSSGIIFVLPEQNGRPTYWQDAYERLKSIVYAKPPDPALPLVIVITEQANHRLSLAEVAFRLDLHKFAEDQLILDVHWIVIQLPARYNTVDGVLPFLSEKICKSLQWLASMLPSTPPLTGQPLREYIEDFLLEEYFTPVLQNLKLRKVKRLLHQAPNVLITLYNSVVEHLAEVASSTDLLNYSWPVAEFVWVHPNEDLPSSHWNTSRHLSYLYEEVSLLQLPRFRFCDFESNSWEQVCEDVWTFISRVVAQNEGKDTVNLVSRIKTLLQKVRDDFEDVCFLEVGQARCEPTYVNMPWTDVIDACITYRLASLSVWDPQEQNQVYKNELSVYYREDDLRNYASPPSWDEAAIAPDSQDGQTLDSTIQKAAENQRNNASMIVQGAPSCNQSLSDVSMETDTAVISAPDDVVESTNQRSKIAKYSRNQNVNNLNNSSVASSRLSEVSMETEMERSIRSECDALAHSVRVEKRKSEQFNKYLESLLQSENETLGAVGTIPRGSPTEELENLDEMEEEFGLNKTLGEKMDTLKKDVKSQRKQSELFEKRLQMLLNS